MNAVTETGVSHNYLVIAEFLEWLEKLLLQCQLSFAVMKRGAMLICCLAWVLGPAAAHAQITNRITYTLLQESYLLDQCLVCGRPDILQPLRGTFDLVLTQDTAPYTAYRIENIQCLAGPGSYLERRLSGYGTYTRFEEFAELQDLFLALQIADSFTNRPAYFTNETRLIEQPFPLLGAAVQQTNGTLIQTFSLNLIAAPLREFWFSTSRGFDVTNSLGKTNRISAGDLISNRGRVVKRNIDLTGRLGIMPILPDLGLDAAQVTQHGEILFSLPVTIFSETLGWIQHGDVVSDRGVIVKRNQDLLAAFHPTTTNDAGLDALQWMPDGRILFSIQSNKVATGNVMLGPGDILSDRGEVYMNNAQLLSAFQPAKTNHDYGLKSMFLWPSGEIWFSVEESFMDQRLGPIQSGDLLSSFGFIVFRNQGLLAAFSPADPGQDYGLNALYVITDTQPPNPPPRLFNPDISNDLVHLEWDGPGAVFQVETAPRLTGPWLPASELITDSSYDATFDPSRGATGFYRLRQW